MGIPHSFCCCKQSEPSTQVYRTASNDHWAVARSRGRKCSPGTTPNGHANSATGQIPVSGTSPDNTAPGTGNSGSTSRWSTPSSTHRSSAISADNISPIHGITALAVTGAASPDSNADENNKPVTTSSSIVTNNHDPEPGSAVVILVTVIVNPLFPELLFWAAPLLLALIIEPQDV